MSQQKILSIYQDVADITGQMLLAAKNSDWESLISLEKRCAIHVGELKKQDRVFPLSEGERQQKIDYIKKNPGRRSGNPLADRAQIGAFVFLNQSCG